MRLARLPRVSPSFGSVQFVRRCFSDRSHVYDTSLPIYLSEVASAMPRSGIREIMDLAWAKEADGHRVIHLEVGQPDFASPPLALQAAKDALDRGETRYIPNAGLPALRMAVAELCNRRNAQYVTTPENVVITVGSMLALHSCLQAILDPGDEVLIPDPYFPNYAMSIQLLGGVAVPYSVKPGLDQTIDISQLKDLVTRKTKAILVNSPSNPGGAVFSLELLQAFSNFATDKEIFLISDEIYSDIVFEPAISGTGARAGEIWAPSILQTKHTPERTILIGGVSKNYSMTGFRVGWLRADEKVATLVSKLQEPVVSCGVAVSQFAALEALKESSQSYVALMRDKYKSRRNAALAVLKQKGLSDLVVAPQGAFYMLVGCESEDSKLFAQDLLREKGVAVAPGSTFGEQAKGSVRIAFSRDEREVVEGMNKFCDFVLERRNARKEAAESEKETNKEERGEEERAKKKTGAKK